MLLTVKAIFPLDYPVSTLQITEFEDELKVLNLRFVLAPVHVAPV